MTVEELAALFRPRNAETKVLAIMEVYLDESGIHDGAKICAVAGYFGHVNSWRKFERLWNPILKRFGVPEYHARRFWARDDNGNRLPPYSDWSDVKAGRFYDALLKAITDCRIFPVGAAVVGHEWQVLGHNERRYLTGGQVKNGKFITTGAPSKKYLPFLQVVYRAGKCCQEQEIANFFFGLDGQFSGYALKYYQEIRSLNQPWCSHLGAIDFPPSALTPPLQAADLLAYETYQYSLERLRRNGIFPLQPKTGLSVALSRMKDAENDFKLFDKHGIDAALESFRKDNPKLCA